MYPEEALDSLERRVLEIEEQFRALVRILQWAEDLDVVRAAAASAMDALREIDNMREG